MLRGEVESVYTNAVYRILVNAGPSKFVTYDIFKSPKLPRRSSTRFSIDLKRFEQMVWYPLSSEIDYCQWPILQWS